MAPRFLTLAGLCLVAVAACKPQFQPDAGQISVKRADAGLPAKKITQVRTATHASWAEIRTASVAWTYLRPRNKTCEWIVTVPRRRPRVISSHPEPCAGGALAWTKDLKRGAWWIPGDPDEIRVMDFGRGSRHSFAPPLLGELADIGFDDGHLVALMRHTADTGLNVKDKEQPAIAHFEGEVYEMGYDGEPGLVLLYMFDDGWQRVEVEPTSYEWDLAAGVEAAPGTQRLGPRSSILADGRRIDWSEIPASDPVRPLLQKIRRANAEAGEDWMSTLGRPRVLGFISSGEFITPEAPLFRELESGDVRPLRSLSAEPGTLLWIRQQGTALAISAGDQRFLVDWVRDRPIAKLPDSVDPLMFWPRTSSTATLTAPK